MFVSVCNYQEKMSKPMECLGEEEEDWREGKRRHGVGEGLGMK